MKLYIDDFRKAPSGWQQAFTAREAIEWIRWVVFTEISFDHDLGCENEAKGFQNGYDVMCFLEQEVFLNDYPVPLMHVHTTNPAAREKMLQTAEFIRSLAEVD